MPIIKNKLPITLFRDTFSFNKHAPITCVAMINMLDAIGNANDSELSLRIYNQIKNPIPYNTPPLINSIVSTLKLDILKKYNPKQLVNA